MGLVSEHLNNLYCNVVIPRRKCRRPKLVPTKTKSFTRARINLNQVWPVLDGDIQEGNRPMPLQSSNNFNIQRDQIHRTNSPMMNSNHQLRGNELMNYTLANIENINNFNHIPLEFQGDASTICENELRDITLRNQIQFYTSCSNINLKNINRVDTNTISHLKANTGTNHSTKGGSKNAISYELPMVTLEDLAIVLGECEKEMSSSDSKSYQQLDNHQFHFNG